MKIFFKLPAEGRQLAFHQIVWKDGYAGCQRAQGLVFRLIPPDHHLANWHDDYQEMLGRMFFGAASTFEKIIRVVGEFERLFNRQPIALPAAATENATGTCAFTVPISFLGFR